jgi:hypothetical protein
LLTTVCNCDNDNESLGIIVGGVVHNPSPFINRVESDGYPFNYDIDIFALVDIFESNNKDAVGIPVTGAYV